jgi:hypothetical protein
MNNIRVVGSIKNGEIQLKGRIRKKPGLRIRIENIGGQLKETKFNDTNTKDGPIWTAPR